MTMSNSTSILYFRDMCESDNMLPRFLGYSLKRRLWFKKFTVQLARERYRFRVLSADRRDTNDLA